MENNNYKKLIYYPVYGKMQQFESVPTFQIQLKSKRGLKAQIKKEAWMQNISIEFFKD